jgi:hypothetical protein
MKKSILFFAAFTAFVSLNVNAQDQYFTKTAKINFDASPAEPIEVIDAVNNEGTSLLNVKTGDIGFMLLVKSFRFERALMEEHFNENYMESTKFPKGDFSGKIDNLSAVNFTKDGTYKVKVSGKLTIHGITQPTTADGVITVKNGKISASSSFSIKLADYKIDRPKVVANKINETVKITVAANYELKKK